LGEGASEVVVVVVVFYVKFGVLVTFSFDIFVWVMGFFFGRLVYHSAGGNDSGQ